MWRAQSNHKFVLTGKFKDLVIAVMRDVLDEFFMRCQTDPEFIKDVFDEIEEDAEDLFFVEWHQPFEGLSTRDKIVLLARVLKALLDPDVPAPELTQYNESAMFAIFEAIAAAIDLEIDYADTMREEGHDPYELRRLVSIIEKEHVNYDDESEPCIDYTSNDAARWTEAVDSLAELILWDLDFIEFSDRNTIADAEPEIAEMAKMVLGIDKDYYRAVVGLVSLDEFLASLEYLLETLTEKT